VSRKSSHNKGAVSDNPAERMIAAAMESSSSAAMPAATAVDAPKDLFIEPAEDKAPKKAATSKAVPPKPKKPKPHYHGHRDRLRARFKELSLKATSNPWPKR